jgi:hypothetical protein
MKWFAMTFALLGVLACAGERDAFEDTEAGGGVTDTMITPNTEIDTVRTADTALIRSDTMVQADTAISADTMIQRDTVPR